MNFCKDCQNFNYGNGRCIREIGKRRDHVHGDQSETRTYFARDERAGNWTLFGRQKCGPDARFFFERKPLPMPPPSMR